MKTGELKSGTAAGLSFFDAGNLTPMRRTLSVFTATGLMLAGLALAVFEIARAEGIRPFLLMGAGLMIGAAGLWLTDEFIQMRRSRSQRR